MAEYCRTIFGDALVIDPLEKYPVGSSAQTRTNAPPLSGVGTRRLSCGFCVPLAGGRTGAPLASGAAGQDSHQEQEEAPSPQALQRRQHPTAGAGRAVVAQQR